MDRLGAAVLIVVFAVALNGGMSGQAFAKDLPSGLGVTGPATVMTETSAQRGVSQDLVAAKSAVGSSLLLDGASITGAADAATLGSLRS